VGEGGGSILRQGNREKQQDIQSKMPARKADTMQHVATVTEAGTQSYTQCGIPYLKASTSPKVL